jgi:hypothetical protein
MLHPKQAAASVLLVAALLPASALADDWLGGSGLFSDPAQWSAGVPGSTDPANFPVGGSVTINSQPSTLSLSIPAASTSFTFVDPPIGEGGDPAPFLPHIYSLLGSAPDTLSVSNASFTLNGGSLTLPNAGGVALSNATANLNGAFLINNSNTSIANNSWLFLNGSSALATSNLAVGGTGSGSVTLSSAALQSPPRIASSSISISSATPNAVAQVDVKNGNITNSGTIYVGGTAAGPQGNGTLQVIAPPGAAGTGTVTTDSLVVYAHGSLLTNSCANIMTRVSTIAGNSMFLSTGGSQGGLHASESVNLLPGSSTYLESNISSPSVTLASGALLTTAGAVDIINGNLTNGGDIRTDGFRVLGTPGANSYSQTSTGTLEGTLGTPLLDVNGPATLGGTLRLTIPDSLTLAAGDSFPIIRAAGISGDFDKIDLIGNIPDGLTAAFYAFTGTLYFTDNPDDVGSPASELPEPLSLALLPTALLALSLRQHRRCRGSP